ncbi:HYC_CC_PP family protein [Aquiflexum lacus]|uniref:HYC_CC_PP family protein n=1 Tax=Aquiflexum lacus TaxID=2483805 RepID=UPI001895E5A5|nr:hypothetical protein [Aquiflexum lacus]
MKSFIKIALLVFYVFFNAGLSYSMHYCGDDFQRINVFEEYKTCCESNVPMPGCCDDVSNLELPNTDQQISDILDFQPQIFELLTFDAPYELPVFFTAIEEKTAFADSSPPIFQNTPIYIFYQVFLI